MKSLKKCFLVIHKKAKFAQAENLMSKIYEIADEIDKLGNPEKAEVFKRGYLAAIAFSRRERSKL